LDERDKRDGDGSKEGMRREREIEHKTRAHPWLVGCNFEESMCIACVWALEPEIKLNVLLAVFETDRDN
jgi:hypothetical protein